MLYLAFAIEILFMLLFPVALGFYLVRRFGVRWGLFGFGALAFVGSQVVRLPLLYGVTIAFRKGLLPSPPERYTFAFNLVVMCFTAGLFEEGARYLVYRYLLKKARSWQEALAFGAGHGGIESILLGLAVVLTLVNMFVLRGMDTSQLPVSGEQATLLAQQVEQFLSLPWYMPLLGGGGTALCHRSPYLLGCPCPPGFHAGQDLVPYYGHGVPRLGQPYRSLHQRQVGSGGCRISPPPGGPLQPLDHQEVQTCRGGEPMIKVEGLTRWFDGTLAVDDLTLEVREGEIFGLLGPNGAGKTTTVRMLACLIAPTSGQAIIDGYKVGEEDTEIRRRIGFR